MPREETIPDGRTKEFHKNESGCVYFPLQQKPSRNVSIKQKKNNNLNHTDSLLCEHTASRLEQNLITLHVIIISSVNKIFPKQYSVIFNVHPGVTGGISQLIIDSGSH
jgi:hypothetical protein